MRAGSVRTELVSRVRAFQKMHPRPWWDFIEAANGEMLDEKQLLEYIETLEELCGLECEVLEHRQPG